MSPTRVEPVSRYTRCLNAATRLQAEGYEQWLAAGHKPPRPGQPLRWEGCAKAAYYMREAVGGKVGSLITQEASITPCTCHSGVSWEDLLDYEYAER